jgi:hypothetical protein
MLAPMFVIARATLAEAPSPIAITQMTAPTPMMIPSMVKAVRILFCASAFSASRGIINTFICRSSLRLRRSRGAVLGLAQLTERGLEAVGEAFGWPTAAGWTRRIVALVRREAMLGAAMTRWRTSGAMMCISCTKGVRHKTSGYRESVIVPKRRKRA